MLEITRHKPSHMSGYVFGLYRRQSGVLVVDGHVVRGEQLGLHEGRTSTAAPGSTLTTERRCS